MRNTCRWATIPHARSDQPHAGWEGEIVKSIGSASGRRDIWGASAVAWLRWENAAPPSVINVAAAYSAPSARLSNYQTHLRPRY